MNKFKPICWHLPRPTTKYEGSYPLNFESKFKKFIGFDDYLHVFSGSCTTGFKVDMKYNEYKPDVVADAHHLPFRDNVFKGALADPPYDDDYAKELYGTPKLKSSKYVKEMIRVVKKGGIIALYHLYLFPRPRDTTYKGVIAIVLMPWKKARLVSIFEKDLHDSEPNGLDRFI